MCNNDIPYDNRVSEYCSKECSKLTINSNRKGSKYNLTEKGLKSLRITSCINFRNGEGLEDILDTSNYTNNCCDYCSTKFYNKRKKKFCSDECRKNKRRIYMDSFKIYKLDTNFKFNLKDFSDEFDFSLVEKHGWYSPTNKNNNLCGVSRDHMLSVREGFELGIDPKLLSHPANCKLMIHNENVSKHKKSSISYEELLERIKFFNTKYPIYFLQFS